MEMQLSEWDWLLLLYVSQCTYLSVCLSIIIYFSNLCFLCFKIFCNGFIELISLATPQPETIPQS